MTDREAMKMALEALEYYQEQTRPIHKTQETIGALRQALAQPEQEHKPWCDYLNIMLTSMPPQKAKCNCKLAQPEQEPVANTIETVCALLRQAHDVLSLSYLPPKREWVSLTDDEIHEAAIKCVKSGQSVNAAIRAIEAQLKERNGG